MYEMQREKLYDAITNIREEYIEEAQINISWSSGKKRIFRNPFWKSFAVTAASLFAAACCGMMVFWGFHSRMGVGGSDFSGGGVNASGHGEGTVFMSYDGPIFPLALREENPAITAERDITLDFSGQGNLRDISVTDRYVLKNDSEQDQTVRILYPFVSTLHQVDAREDTVPVLKAGGAELGTEIFAGDYAGGFQGAMGEDARAGEALLNLEEPKSWEDYRSLLSDGSYREKAFCEWPDLTEYPAVVYKFTNPSGPGRSDKIPNPTIHVNFELDYDRTRVLAYGFDGYSRDWDKGYMDQTFSIREPEEAGYGTPHYLIILGDDVENLRTAGFVTGGWDTKKTIEYSVDMERYETNLEEVLREIAGYLFEWKREQQEVPGSGGLDFEVWYGALADYLLNYYGIMPGKGIARYDTGWIQDMDFSHVDRVFYLEAEVTVPAGGETVLTAEMAKQPSFDHYCAKTENQCIDGFDLVTTLGSELIFTRQSAALLGAEGIEIVRQNFGFDPENGVDCVELNLDQEHYFIEIIRKKGER